MCKRCLPLEGAIALQFIALKKLKEREKEKGKKINFDSFSELVPHMICVKSEV